MSVTHKLRRTLWRRETITSVARHTGPYPALSTEKRSTLEAHDAST